MVFRVWEKLGRALREWNRERAESGEGAERRAWVATNESMAEGSKSTWKAELDRRRSRIESIS